MKSVISTIIGILFGLIYCIIMYDNKINSNPKLVINFGSMIRNSHIYLFNKHIHHWLIFLFILVLTFVNKLQITIFKKYIYQIRGFSIIMILHGLSYSDWYIF